MMRRHSRFIALSALVVLGLVPTVASGQVGAVTLRGAPQYVSYGIGTGATKNTISQFSIPIFGSVPIGSNIVLDIGTSFATSTLTSSGTSTSLSGLTDTQLRGSYSMMDGGLVLTLGMNVPTGTASVPQSKVNVAGFIGTDLLGFPVPVYGSGFAITGGAAIARTVGDWNLGGGASMRAASAFVPLQLDSGTSPRYTPGSEVRATFGADRALGDGRFALGATYSAFAGEKYGTGTFTNATGARFILQTAVTKPLGPGRPDLFFGAWNLFVGEGTRLNAPYPSQNITNAQLALGFHVGRVTIEPNVEGRIWRAGSTGNGLITFLGLRTRIPAGSFLLFPGASFGFGNLKSNVTATPIDNSFSGLRASLGATWTP